MSVPEEPQVFPVETAGQEIPERQERAVQTAETVRPVLLGAMARMGEMGPQESREGMGVTEPMEEME